MEHLHYVQIARYELQRIQSSCGRLKLAKGDLLWLEIWFSVGDSVPRPLRPAVSVDCVLLHYAYKHLIVHLSLPFA